MRALEELGFRRVGRIGAVVVPGGVEALARGYPPDQRELFNEHAPIPSDVLRAPDGSAFVIGEAGLTTALYEAGYTLVESDPDYVVLGETRTYSFEQS